jgi:ADP-ribosyl-[dinitrogen reductase] hydrolase
MGGDADTIAAITGGLAGAYFGYDAIPERWIRELAPEVRERLDRLAEAALANRTMEQRRN